MHKSSYKMGVLGHFMNCVPLPLEGADEHSEAGLVAIDSMLRGASIFMRRTNISHF